MHCFICVTYMIILCSTNPTKSREIATTHEKRSLFRDVIESLRIRSQLPEDINQNDENNVAQNYERYGYENEPLHLPSDAEYVPRRNDRIEMPSLKYRFPKSMELESKDNLQSKESVVLYIDAHSPKLTTQKPKRDKNRPRPGPNKTKFPSKINENEEISTEPDTDDSFPYSNTMAGQSQIGNRESQTVVKPTVIVNIRGSVNNRDSDIRLEARDDDNSTVPLQNIFNINQEVKIGTEIADKRKDPSVKQEIKLVPKETTKVEEDMMMCETATWKQDKTENRKFDNVFQILFSL